ncbi:uncharacterized protein LOC116633315 [Phoca vitulina]|uniref:uncharacterized protein LOC116633315 n=1 Tax=Phoca vitulina TaxID=9720 RepID=UPI001396451E|nr:uncharacterized protein LOC116633315 [Phoca vitulina]
MGILSLLGNRKVQPIHTECDMFRLWLGPCEARRAGRPGATAEAGPGRQAPDQGTEQSGRKPRQGRPSGQHPPLRSFRMLQSRQSQVHKREEVHGGPKAYDPLLTTIFKPQDEASAVAHPHPRGRCQPVMPCLMGSLGGGQKGPSSPTRSVSGRGCWESPPTKGQRLPEVLPGGPPPEEFQPGEAKYWVFFCFFVVFFFFYQTEMLLISNLLILSILLVKGEEVAGKPPEAGQGPPGVLSPLGVQGRTRAGSGGCRGHLQGNTGPAAPAGRPSSMNGDTRLLMDGTEETDSPSKQWWGGTGGENKKDEYNEH